MAAEKSIKDRLIEKTAEDVGQPLTITEDVLRWMFKDMIKALRVNTQVEMSGLGTFLMSKAKVRRRIETLNIIKERLQAFPDGEEKTKKLQSVEEELQYFYLKTNELQKEVETNTRRVEKPDDSPREAEGRGSQSVGREVGDMQGM